MESTWEAVLRAEIARLRALLAHYRLEPDRCSQFPRGERCALPHGHEGGCQWERGD